MRADGSLRLAGLSSGQRKKSPSGQEFNLIAGEAMETKSATYKVKLQTEKPRRWTLQWWTHKNSS